MKYTKYVELSDGLRTESNLIVSHVLENDLTLDLTYNDGEFFILAVDNGNGNVDVLKILVDYFEKNQLSKYQEGSYACLSLRKNMLDIVAKIVDDVKISEDMQAVLGKYLPKEEDYLVTIATDNSADAFWDPDLDGACRLNSHYVPAFKNKVKALLMEYRVQQVDEFLQKLRQESTIDDVPSQSTLYRWHKEKYNLDEETYFERIPNDLPQSYEIEQPTNFVVNTANTQEEKKQESNGDKKIKEFPLLDQQNIESAETQNIQLAQNQNIIHKNLNLKFKSLGELPESKGNKQLQHDLGYNSDDEHNYHHSTRSHTPPAQDLAHEESHKENLALVVIEKSYQDNIDDNRDTIGNDSYLNQDNI